MKHEFSKFREQETEQAEGKIGEQEKTNPAAREFGNVEELLRYDAEQNPVPPEVAERVNESIARETPPDRSWWQRIFGGGN